MQRTENVDRKRTVVDVCIFRVTFHVLHEATTTGVARVGIGTLLLVVRALLLLVVATTTATALLLVVSATAATALLLIVAAALLVAAFFLLEVLLAFLFESLHV